MSRQQPHDSKVKLLDAALQLIRTKGYAGTTIDDICRHADVTKGSFFHHFKGKDDLALAAVTHWDERTENLFAAAAYHQASDPLDRLLGYLDFRQALLQGGAANYTCLLGTLVQEIHATHPDILAACDNGLARHVAELTRDVELAKARYAPQATWSVEDLAYFVQVVLQGAFIFSKAQQSPQIAHASIEHLRRYLKALFVQSEH